ncbi:MAG: hypothetical protein ABI950_00320 [Solirubrobacteraceae bacterium]
MARAIENWGATAAEAATGFPCDRLLPDADVALFRAVDVAAPAATTFRWLCQLRVAPYSYDAIDNFGKPSPRALTPGLERLEAGQRFMRIFRLAGFEPGRSLTLVTASRLFGRVACTYAALPAGPERSRIVVKMLVAYRPFTRLVHPAFAAGDLVMMRRQLLNLAALAAA